MPNPNIYTDALSTFLMDYPIDNYDLKNWEIYDRKIKAFDNFLVGGGVGNNSAAQFADWAARTLSEYLTSQLRKGMTDFSNFSLQDFLDAFDMLADAKYKSELQDGQEPTRKPHAGASRGKIETAFRGVVKAFNKPLSTAWTENLKEGLISISDMTEITSSAYDLLNSGQDTKEGVAEELKQMVAAHEAMRQLRESRKGILGWFWKLFNGEQNRQEKAYYETLKEQIQSLKGMEYDVEKATEEMMGKNVFGKEMKAETKESPAKNASKAMKVEPVAGQLAQKMKGTFLGDLKNEWKQNLPKDITLSDITLQYAIGTPLLKGIKALNEKFDQRVAAGNDPKKEMDSLVQGVFKLTASLSSKHITNKTELEKVEAIKVIAQAAVHAATPAALYPQELGSMVETYINQNVDQYTTLVRVGKDYLQEMGKYDMSKDSREQVFNQDHPFVEDGGKIAPQVSQPVKQNVNTLSN